MLIDSLYSIALQSILYGSGLVPSFAEAFELVIQGLIEFESTNLRILYSANEAPGFRDVRGEFSEMRVGYDGPGIALISLLVPMIFILGMACVYVCLGVRTQRRHISGFEPTNNLSLIIASAAGGAAGYLPLLRNGNLDPTATSVMSLRVRYAGSDGLIAVNEMVTEDLQLLQPGDTSLDKSLSPSEY